MGETENGRNEQAVVGSSSRQDCKLLLPLPTLIFVILSVIVFIWFSVFPILRIITDICINNLRGNYIGNLGFSLFKLLWLRYEAG